MPAKQFPSKPDLNHLKYQARDLLKWHAAHDRRVAQRIREFHPRLRTATDEEIFAAALKLSDAQLTIAREYGFKSWARLKAHVESPDLASRLTLPHHERIEDAVFRHAVDLLDVGDEAGLREHLKQHPKLVLQHVEFEGGNYFHAPTLLEFIAENPVRNGTLPGNIVEVARVILDAGPDHASCDAALGLVVTGRVVEECGVQIALIELLCDYGADPDSGIRAAATQQNLAAAHALIARGAQVDLTIAAAMGRVDDARRMLPIADAGERHLALAFASQKGEIEIVRLLLDAGEDPNRYNPLGSHSHSTPLHQAALYGHVDVVRLLIERGARVDMKDLLWQGTPADWAKHEGRTEAEILLRKVELQCRSVSGGG
ncbi:ankyrin repeat domain-containing protein [Telmatobacter sp. DSM 110680]|uniref:Ankyrin repeat domain-containing protein n=1 Tax=Telmatobacter sp. DSM 110680 TaxID=3036704 RepID=A0AAU7DP34_9BACT